MAEKAEKQPCLVIPRRYVAAEDRSVPPIPERGFFANPANVTHFEMVVLHSGESKFMKRWDAEHNPSWVQPVVPMVVTHEDKVLYIVKKPYEDKGNGQYVEDRITAPDGQKPDILFASGHIEAHDLQKGDKSSSWGLRELHEELVIPETTVITPRPWGVVNDRTTTVGRVHLGLVHQVEVSDPNISVNAKEQELEQAKWVKISDILDYHPRLDSWSFMIAEQLHIEHSERQNRKIIAMYSNVANTYIHNDNSRV